jgi:hypothetical protein
MYLRGATNLEVWEWWSACRFPQHFNRWKNYFSQLMNVSSISDVKQIEIHTAEPSVPDPSHFEIKITIAKLKYINHQVVIKFQKSWFKQEVKHYCMRSINSLVLFGIRKNCMISRRSLLLYQFTKRVIKLTAMNSIQNFLFILHSRLSAYDGIISVGFDLADQILIRFSARRQYTGLFTKCN